MEIVTIPADELRALIGRYEQVTNRLIEAEKELAALKEDKYVTYEWICEFFDISKKTALLMLSEVKPFVYGSQIKRFKKSEILKFAERNSVKVKYRKIKTSAE